LKFFRYLAFCAISCGLIPVAVIGGFELGGSLLGAHSSTLLYEYGPPSFSGYFEWATMNFGIGYLAVLGVAFGWFQPRLPQWVFMAGVAWATTLAFYIFCLFHDFSLRPTSHNLWPFEILVVTPIASITFGGGYAGSRARAWAAKRGR